MPEFQISVPFGNFSSVRESSYVELALFSCAIQKLLAPFGLTAIKLQLVNKLTLQISYQNYLIFVSLRILLVSAERLISFYVLILNSN